MSTAKIFAYNGNLGAEINPEGKFINDPFDGDQLGAVISTSEIEISKEAKDLIRNARRERGSFAPLMLTEHADSTEHGKSSIAIIGMGKVHLGTDFSIGRACTLSALEDCKEVPNEVPEDYKAFIDGGAEDEDEGDD